MDKLIEFTKGEDSPIKDYDVLYVDNMEMMEEESDDEGRNVEDEDFDDRDFRNAMRNKKDFEIFIGSLPTNADGRELASYFRSKRVKITNIRILKSICVVS